MSGIIENIHGNNNELFNPGDINNEDQSVLINSFDNKKNNCYSCKPRGTLKEHIISQNDDYVFNHDMFRRPVIIITTIKHYHTIYDIPDLLKLKLFEDIRIFNDFWNLKNNYQLMFNNGDYQTHHHFHVKMKINDAVANRMRRDHFSRINLEKSYVPSNSNNYQIIKSI